MIFLQIEKDGYKCDDISDIFDISDRFERPSSLDDMNDIFVAKKDNFKKKGDDISDINIRYI